MKKLLTTIVSIFIINIIVAQPKNESKPLHFDGREQDGIIWVNPDRDSLKVAAKNYKVTAIIRGGDRVENSYWTINDGQSRAYGYKSEVISEKIKNGKEIKFHVNLTQKKNIIRLIVNYKDGKQFTFIRTILNETPSANIPVAREGKTYALFIANADYNGNQSFKNLNPSPIVQAEEIKNILNQYYNFESIEILKDKTKKQILDRLDYYSNLIQTKDQFFLLFSGHGTIDYWHVKGASNSSDSQNIIATKDITHKLKTIKAIHKFVIIDACHGGSFLNKSTQKPKNGQSVLSPQSKGESRKSINCQKRKTMRSATALTSVTVNQEALNDYKFVKKFIEILTNFSNDDCLTDELIYDILKHESEQILDFGKIPNNTDDNGLFIFPLKK